MALDVLIHVYDYVLLGGQDNWDWRQEGMCGTYWRLYWNRSAGAWIRTAYGMWQMEPDSLFLMAPGTTYATGAEDRVEHFYIHFSLSIDLVCAPPFFYVLQDKLALQLVKHTIDSLCTSPAWKVELALKSLITHALSQLQDDAVYPPREYDSRITSAMALIERNAVADNQDLAEAAGMSLSGFINLFVREVGVPPQIWVRKKRVDAVCKLLHFSDKSIDEIALLTGFCDRYHLSRVFKQTLGIGPAHYRKQAAQLRDIRGIIPIVTCPR